MTFYNKVRQHLHGVILKKIRIICNINKEVTNLRYLYLKNNQLSVRLRLCYLKTNNAMLIQHKEGDNMVSTNCIFCNIINRQMPVATIFENSEFKVIMDRYPAAQGHTLIMPKEHVENIFELDSETVSRLFVLAAHVAKVLKKKLNCEGMNLLQNNGEVAGQTVPHFHLHLIPRFENDNLNFHWETLKVSEEELEQMASDIADLI